MSNEKKLARDLIKLLNQFPLELRSQAYADFKTEVFKIYYNSNSKLYQSLKKNTMLKVNEYCHNERFHYILQINYMELKNIDFHFVNAYPLHTLNDVEINVVALFRMKQIKHINNANNCRRFFN